MQHLLQALISIGNPLNMFKKMSPKPTLFHCNGTYVLPEVAMLLQMFFFYGFTVLSITYVISNSITVIERMCS